MNHVAASERRDDRAEERDAVRFDVTGFGPDAQPLTLEVENLSPHGFKARCMARLALGDRLRLRVPELGVAAAEVRWARDGRVGCRLDVAMDRASYYELLARVLRSS